MARGDFRDLSGDYESGKSGGLTIPLLLGLLALSGGSKNSVTVAGITIGGGGDPPDPPVDPPDPPIVVETDHFYQWSIPSNVIPPIQMKITYGAPATAFTHKVLDGVATLGSSYTVPSKALSTMSGNESGTLGGVYPTKPFGQEFIISENDTTFTMAFKTATLSKDKELVGYILSHIICMGSDGATDETLLWSPNVYQPYTETTPSAREVHIYHDGSFVYLSFSIQKGAWVSDKRWITMTRLWDVSYFNQWEDWNVSGTYPIDLARTIVSKTFNEKQYTVEKDSTTSTYSILCAPFNSRVCGPGCVRSTSAGCGLGKNYQICTCYTTVKVCDQDKWNWDVAPNNQCSRDSNLTVNVGYSVGVNPLIYPINSKLLFSSVDLSSDRWFTTTMDVPTGETVMVVLDPASDITEKGDYISAVSLQGVAVVGSDPLNDALITPVILYQSDGSETMLRSYVVDLDTIKTTQGKGVQAFMGDYAAKAAGILNTSINPDEDDMIFLPRSLI